MAYLCAVNKKDLSQFLLQFFSFTVTSALLMLSFIAYAGPSGFTSDDYNSSNLNTTLWSFIDPSADGSATLNGTQLQIYVPAGSSHDAWSSGNSTARIVQSVTDADFELEVKFESIVTSQYQLQGILVEQDANNFIRFDFHSDGSNTRIFVATIIGSSASQKVNNVISDRSPMYMRVKRVGNEWTQSFSVDGIIWNTSVIFTQILTVNSAGVFAGNVGGSGAPEHTAVVDYMFSTDLTVEPEDGVVTADNTAPFIRDIKKIAGSDQFQILWETDEPATGVIDYGVTTSYELGMVDHTNLSSTHDLTVNGLTPGTVINYRLRSTDGSSNEKVSANSQITVSANPYIDDWRGPNYNFGQLGSNSARWVNILGHVSGESTINSLKYSLNSQTAQTLSTGADGRRLQDAGDFNVDIEYLDLNDGANTLDITAVDTQGNTTTNSLTVNYSSNNIWPLPYSVDWSAASSIEDVSQVVDGSWLIESNGVRTTQLGYDRILSIGDINWYDYEATVPVTLHGIDSICFTDIANNPCNGGALVGLLARWQGHHPTNNNQPSHEWKPLGAFGAYRWKYNGSNLTVVPSLQLFGGDGSIVAEDKSAAFPIGVPQFMKIRAQTVGGQHEYKVKLWEQGTLEPSQWNLESTQTLVESFGNGSLLLIAHYADVTFGNVSVVALDGGGDVTPPIISNVKSSVTETTATITWTTDEPSDSSTNYGLDTNYENAESNASLVVSHSLALTGLTANTEYHYQVESTDSSTNIATSIDYVFTTASENTGSPSGIESDNFDDSVFNSSLWTFSDPVGDSSVSMTGSQLAISIPAGTDHDLWTNANLAPRVLQPTNNTDFELEAKFDSLLTEKFQLQGITAEQDANNLVRFDFYSDGKVTKIFSATIVNGVATKKIQSTITTTAPMYLRVTRQGDLWTESYSFDGVNWTVAGSYTHALAVKNVSVFGGSGGSNPPAHTVLVDYFTVDSLPPGSGGDTTPPVISNIQVSALDTTSTITWETNEVSDSLINYGLDSDYGSVQSDSSLVTSHSIELSALTPGTVYSYQVVSTDGSTNTSSSVNLEFTTASEPDTTSPVISNVQVSVTYSQATITWDTDEASDSTINYGLDTSYGLLTNDSALVTSHSITLDTLASETSYHYQISSTDNSTNTATSIDLTFTTAANTGSPSGLMSDGFDAGVLNTSVWSFVDPVGDSAVSMTGTEVSISLPQGVSHDLWSNKNLAPRIRQAANNTDFELEVKFNSSVFDKYQSQGIAIEQDDNNLVFFHFYFSTSTKVFSASIVNDQASKKVSQKIVDGNPLYLKVARSGDNWTQSYSYDGANWIVAASYTHALTVNSVSLFAGNSGTTPPAHTALIDYFIVDGMDPDSQPDTTPPVISNIQVQEGEDSATVTWDTNEASDSIVDFGLDNTYGAQNSDTNLVTSHTLMMTGLTKDTEYHYQISSTDGSLNSASSVDLTFSTLQGDITPPVISNIQVIQTDTTATISWDTDELSDSTVNYGVDISYGQMKTDAGLATSHSLTLDGLTAGTEYHYQISSADGDTNNSDSVDLTFTTNSEADTTPPVISNILVSSTDTAATVTWDTDELSTSSVDYGLDSTYGLNQGDAAHVTSHSIELPGLTSDTEYHYQITSTDVSGNPGNTIDLTFMTDLTVDIDPPIISNIQITKTETTAIITWDTNEQSDSVIDYGLDANYGQNTNDTTLVTNHSITLTGLTSATQYHYRISTTDSSTNTSQSNDQSFITSSGEGLLAYWAMDEGTGSTASDATGNNNTGTLVNDPLWVSGAGLDFDGVNDYVNVGPINVGGEAITITAWIKADNLSNCSAKDCRIFSKASGTSTQAHYYMISSIKRKGDGAPVLRFRLKAGGTTDTLIATYGVITENLWIHIAAVYDGSSMTLYKDGVEVGSTPKTGSIDIDNTVSTWIGGNPPSATVRPWDGQVDDVKVYGRALTSAEVNTMANEDFTAPVISNMQVIVTDTEATISWDTNELANSAINYGIDTTYGAVSNDSTEVINHSLTLTALTPGTTYHYQITSTDGSLNSASSADLTFNTLQADTTPPVISNIQVNQTDTTATISWDTDELSDSTVNYGIDLSYGQMKTDAGLVTSHSLTLEGLTADTDYHYQISSADGETNNSDSVDLTFTTNSEADTTPPLISNIIVSSTDSIATVSWDTDELSNSTVDYGLDSTYGLNQSDAANVTNHSIELSGLTSDTEYHYQITSSDVSGNPASTIDLTFMTDVTVDIDPPIISNIQVTKTETTATITWDTNEQSDSIIDYGLDTSYGQNTNDTTLVTNHSIKLTGLTSATEYHYRISSSDSSANTIQSNGLSFITSSGTGLLAHWMMDEGTGSTTLDSTGNNNTGILVNDPLWVSGAGLDFDGVNDYVNVGPINLGGEAITITAWIKADNLLNCSAQDCRIFSKASGTSTQDHYYMISSIKRNGDGAPVLRFRLKTGGTTDTLIATSGVITENKWIHIAAVYDGATMKLYNDGVEVGSTPKTGSIDIDNSVSTWIGGNPPSATVRPWDGQIDDVKVYGRALTSAEVSTMASEDFVAPVISNIKVIVTDIQSTISWDTSELADSVINYGLNTSYGTVSSDNTEVTSHSLTLTDLTPGDLYHYQIISSDSSGNASNSNDLTFTTLTEPDNTAPVISNIQTSVSEATAIITWTTDEAGNSTVNYGLNSTYGLSSSDETLETNHSLLLTGLTPSTSYHFQAVSTDLSGNKRSSTDQTFTTSGVSIPENSEAIYGSNNDVTYKEYWVDHIEFDGACGEELRDPGAFYIEPYSGCDKTLQFEIPDDFSQAGEIKIYLDLWRNRDTPRVRFTLNGNSTVYAPNVGSDWSRTPYLATVNKQELVQGTNTITFTSAKKIHVHDVGFRIYYDNANPLIAGIGSDVTPPTGQLTSVVASNGSFNPLGGGVLDVDNNIITFNASANNADYVEFHGYYYGYDENNDGTLTDWHNLKRLELNPGPGGTIDHIGTDTSSPYSVTWNMPHIINQGNVRFKVRIVDSSGNVREAAGGISGGFTLSRSYSVESYIVPNFEDDVTHHGGTHPDLVTRTIELPSNISDVTDAYFIGAYWNRPYVTLNNNTQFRAGASDHWQLDVRQISPSQLVPGTNQIEYEYDGSGFGEFIEKPGPMVILIR